jgi:hypothetical protein
MVNQTAILWTVMKELQILYIDLEHTDDQSGQYS